MTDRFMLRTPLGLENFNSDDELLARVKAIFAEHKERRGAAPSLGPDGQGMFLYMYDAQFGDAPSRHTDALVTDQSSPVTEATSNGR